MVHPQCIPPAKEKEARNLTWVGGRFNSAESHGHCE
jgi:hypothetical protein